MKQWYVRSLLLAVALLTMAGAPTATAQQESVPESKHEAARQQEARQEGTPENSAFLNRRIATIAFRGNQAFSSEMLLQAFRLMQAGKKFHPEMLQADLDRMRVFFYVDNGYLQASTGKPEIADTPDGLHIVVPIEEGALSRIGKITVKGGTLFSSDEIIAMLGWVSGDVIRGYSVINTSLEHLRWTYQDRGYIHFSADFLPEFHEPLPGANEAITDIVVELDEGKAYRIDKIIIEAAHNSDEQQLRSLLTIREGELFRQSRLEKSLERIREFLQTKNDPAYSLSSVAESVVYLTDEKAEKAQLTFRLLEQFPIKSPPVLRKTDK